VAKNIQSQNFCMENGRRNSGFIVATEPLNDETWQPFSGGNLIVFKDGKIVENLD